MTPRVLVLRTAGTNCDEETAFAFARAGAAPERVHLGRLVAQPSLLRDCQILCLPGGFTYGDDLSAGKILANQIRAFLQEEVVRFVDRGGLVLGICNGFQALVKAGLLPGLSRPWRIEATLAANAAGRFECRWVDLAVPEGAASLFTRGLSRLSLPVAHAEGRFVPASPEVLARIRAGRQIAFRYVDAAGGPAAYPANPSGAVDGIAGISDPTGQVLGLMPHPERNVLWHHSPSWTRRLSARDGDGEGLQVFRNAVDSVK